MFPVAYQPVQQQRAAPHGEADTGEKKRPWMYPSNRTKEVPDRVLPPWMTPSPRRGTRDQDSFGGGRPNWMNPPSTFKGTRGVSGGEGPNWMDTTNGVVSGGDIPNFMSRSTATSTRGGKPSWLLPSTNTSKVTQQPAAESRTTCKSQSTISFRGAKEATAGGTGRTLMYPSAKTPKDTHADTGGDRPIWTAPSDSAARGAAKDAVSLDTPFWLPPLPTNSKGTQAKTGEDETSLLYPLSCPRGSPKAMRRDRPGSFSPFYTMGGTYDVTGGDRPDWMVPSTVSINTQNVSDGERPGWMFPSPTPKGTYFPRR